jgi:hypothetical protein
MADPVWFVFSVWRFYRLHETTSILPGDNLTLRPKLELLELITKRFVYLRYQWYKGQNPLL